MLLILNKINLLDLFFKAIKIIKKLHKENLKVYLKSLIVTDLKTKINLLLISWLLNLKIFTV